AEGGRGDLVRNRRVQTKRRRRDLFRRVERALLALPGGQPARRAIHQRARAIPDLEGHDPLSALATRSGDADQTDREIPRERSRRTPWAGLKTGPYSHRRPRVTDAQKSPTRPTSTVRNGLQTGSVSLKTGPNSHGRVRPPTSAVTD